MNTSAACPPLICPSTDPLRASSAVVAELQFRAAADHPNTHRPFDYFLAKIEIEIKLSGLFLLSPSTNT
jgi:hypothetical protein